MSPGDLGNAMASSLVHGAARFASDATFGSAIRHSRLYWRATLMRGPFPASVARFFFAPAQKGCVMPTPTKVYPRRTVAVGICLDRDAHQLLLAMVPPTHYGMGALVSECIRREARERLTRCEDIERLRQLHAARAKGETSDQ
jgi:hypothetical protein